MRRDGIPRRFINMQLLIDCSTTGVPSEKFAAELIRENAARQRPVLLSDAFTASAVKEKGSIFNAIVAGKSLIYPRQKHNFFLRSAGIINEAAPEPE